MAALQTAVAVALIIIGFALVCVALIWRDRAQPEPAELEDSGELREFVDSLPPIGEEDHAPPRINRIRRNRNSSVG
jgi:hypothetical protein